MKNSANPIILVGLSLIITVAVVLYAVNLHIQNTRLHAELAAAELEFARVISEVGDLEEATVGAVLAAMEPHLADALYEAAAASNAADSYRDRLEEAQARLEQAKAVIAELETRRFRYWSQPELNERRNRVLDDLPNHPELAGWEGRRGRVFLHAEYLMGGPSGGNGFVFAISDDGYNSKYHVFYYEILQDDGSFIFTWDTENDGEIVWTHVASFFDRWPAEYS